jgi:2-succinyl-5-enolpyruvyl-6-hydroxy-3-cyclohexene-1-carboxylate synthase
MFDTKGGAGDSLEPINPTYTYVGAFVDELRRSQMCNVVICPGSRSTPLALAFAANPAIHIWTHVDERSAAFFALGMAKRLQQPVAVLCTSGTAAANFFPAVIEANLTHIPLIVLTADRPHELRDCGAPQAIDQNRLYGTHVKWFVDVALPEATNAALRYIRTIADRAVARALAVPTGPVHLNMPFREPLVPEPPADQDRNPDLVGTVPRACPPRARPPLRQGQGRLPWEGRPDGLPYVGVDEAALASVAQTTIQRLAGVLSIQRRGLIIVGANSNLTLIEPLLRLAQRLGYPILADPLSQFRSGPHQRDSVLTSYDAFLRVDAFVEEVEPEVVLRFGPMPTSKSLLLYLKRYAHCPQIVVDGQGGWDEPTQLASEMIHADPVLFCRDLLEALPAINLQRKEWLSTWQRVDDIARKVLYRAMLDFPQVFEGRVCVELAELLPSDSTLFVGNSMPIRDMDAFFWGSERRIRVLGNRGANGIDGVISTALGVSAASTKDEHTVLVIGDLSFFHDLNGLLAARLHALNLTIVLINNDGGGIFSFLPQSAYPQHFEQLFGTPTGLDFQPVVQMYGGYFQRVQDWSAFRVAIEQSFQMGGLHVVEVTTERQSNVAMHRQLWRAVENAL